MPQYLPEKRIWPLVVENTVQAVFMWLSCRVSCGN